MTSENTFKIHVTTQEAAQMLGLSPRTLEGMRRGGRGPKFFKYGCGKNARVYYARSEVLRWARQRRHTSTAEYAGRSPDDGPSSQDAAMNNLRWRGRQSGTG